MPHISPNCRLARDRPAPRTGRAGETPRQTWKAWLRWTHGARNQSPNVADNVPSAGRGRSRIRIFQDRHCHRVPAPECHRGPSAYRRWSMPRSYRNNTPDMTGKAARPGNARDRISGERPIARTPSVLIEQTHHFAQKTANQERHNCRDPAYDGRQSSYHPEPQGPAMHPATRQRRDRP